MQQTVSTRAAASPCARPPLAGYQQLQASRRRGPARGGSTSVARAAQAGSGIKQMSAQMKDMRRQLEEDEQLSVLMSSLRGSNLSDADFAEAGVTMQLMEMVGSDGDDDQLPLAYDPARIAEYWQRRPVAVTKRILQLMTISGGFLGKLALDAMRGRLKDTEVDRAIQLRQIMTSLGPAYIKLGQALAIRPDILSPAAMNELQQLCDKVPSFDSKVAMEVLRSELGAPWQEVYAELSSEPIAAASLGQVYKGRLKTGEEVAVKVQRPYVLETVTVDLFVIRKLGVALRRFPKVTERVDIVSLLDEWAVNFYRELDYILEAQNATRFADMLRDDLPQVVVPKSYMELTSRRVLTSQWLNGEKLSQSQEADVADLVNVGVIAYLKQLLDTGMFHADPHPGNLIRTPDGRLAILDFGLMCEIDPAIRYGMIEAISHLVHRDYEAIVGDFVTLGFIPPGTDLKPILPVLAKVFDTALAGGGAKGINFQDLAADLAQITFDYPFRIPPYFALVIRAIGVLEGIALVGDPGFAIVDEAYPYISKLLMTDQSPRLRAALQYMVFGKEGVFDADRLIDLLDAFETFTEASQSARGDMDLSPELLPVAVSRTSTMPDTSSGLPSTSGRPFLLGMPGGAAPAAQLTGLVSPLLALSPMSTSALAVTPPDARTREALRFVFSPDGSFFREFLMEELVKSVDALSRNQLRSLLAVAGLENVMVPVLIPGAARLFAPVAPPLSEQDRRAVENVTKIGNFLTGGNGARMFSSSMDPRAIRELLPYLPGVGAEILPELSRRLFSRVSARLLKELFI